VSWGLTPVQERAGAKTVPAADNLNQAGFSDPPDSFCVSRINPSSVTTGPLGVIAT
jgi:hypothetical protein